jgi:hypothetical protein
MEMRSTLSIGVAASIRKRLASSTGIVSRIGRIVLVFID